MLGAVCGWRGLAGSLLPEDQLSGLRMFLCFSAPFHQLQDGGSLRLLSMQHEKQQVRQGWEESSSARLSVLRINGEI